MLDLRQQVQAAESSLRAVLHESLESCSVQDLDGILVELVEVAWRVSELADRLERSLGCRADLDGLRLDAHGRELFLSPADALVVAAGEVGHGAAGASSAARFLHDARQVTSTIGLVIVDESEEVEF